MTNFDRPDRNTCAGDAHAPLEEGRRAYASRRWGNAYRSLSVADQATPLGVEDLERLATSAYLIGHDDGYLRTLERAHRAYLDSSETPRAVRCAFWLGLRFFLRGETGPATGWLARAQRLLEREDRDCVEQGYLLLPGVMQHIDAADWEAALATATAAAAIGDRFGEADLSTAARYFQGRILLRRAQVEEGLALLDEAMVAVTAGELSPVTTGLIYCGVIDGCQQVYALGRAQQWTAALNDWCAQQPELVFTGICLVHRAEIMRLRGAWLDAIEEARRASERLSQRADQQTAAAAFYQEAEVHRLRGEFAAAEEAYRSASQWGWAAVLDGIAAHARGAVALAEGDAEAALGPLRRAFEVWQQVEAPYLAARVRVQIGLACRAVGDADGARLELDAARTVFERLGASPDLARLGALAEPKPSDRPRGLSPRELQVLCLVAAGQTNKAIAAKLFLSEKTVDRHVSNIFSKLGVPTRAAATAYAYEHKLI